MSLTIYGIAASRAVRPLWAATELGLDFKHVNLAYQGGATHTPAFLALNPNGHIPVVVDQRAAAQRGDDQRAVDGCGCFGERALPAGEIDLFQQDEAFVLAREVREQGRETVGGQRAHREDEGAAGAVRFLE